MPDTGLTALLAYALNGPPERFMAAARDMAARVRREGHAGVLGYRLWCDDAAGTAQGVVDYTGAAAWAGHHGLIASWPELAALRAAARLDRVLFLGPADPGIAAWMAQHAPGTGLSWGGSLAAGFLRRDDPTGSAGG